MKQPIEVKTVNGMALKLAREKITGIGTRLQDGTYLTVEVAGGLSFPIHPDSQKQFLKLIYQEGGQA